MYGIIQECLKEWVLETLGEAVWDRIVVLAGLDEARFLKFRNYPDALTLGILDATCQLTGLEKEIILERLGHYFLPYAFKNGYGDMILSIGNTLDSFLANVDYLHWYLMSTAYPEILSPSFCLAVDEEGNLILNYYSHRSGFHSLAVGLIQAIGFHIFGISTRFSTLSREIEAIKLDKKLFCVTFRVECTDNLTSTCLKEAELASTVFKSMNFQTGVGVRLSSRAASKTRTLKSSVCHADASQHLPLATSFITLRKMSLLDESTVMKEVKGRITALTSPSPQWQTSFERYRSHPFDFTYSKERGPSVRGQARRSSESALPNARVKGEEKKDDLSTFSLHHNLEDDPGDQQSPLCPHPFISNIHPYHVFFSKDLQVLGMGKALASLMEEEEEEKEEEEEGEEEEEDKEATRRLRTSGRTGKSRSPHPLLTDVFDLVWPDVPLTYVNMARFRQLVFQFRLKVTRAMGLELKGELLWWSNEVILFVGSPLVKSLEELRLNTLCVADLPKHDSTRELVLLKHQRTTEFDLMKQLEETTAQLQGTAKALEEEKARTDLLLEMMVPPSVAVKLKNGERVQESFSEVTVMFADVVQFTSIAAQCTPIQVVDMLNLLYMKFDAKTEEYNVYKVETIGDAYMVVGGAPVTVSDHAERVARLALAIIAEATSVPDPVFGTPLQVRAGMHSGPVVAGCVGVKMPRYCFFGDTVNTASRMETYSLPGKVHITRQTYELLRGRGYRFTQREQLDIKGKGHMTTYFLDSGPHGSASSTSVPTLSPPPEASEHSLSCASDHPCHVAASPVKKTEPANAFKHERGFMAPFAASLKAFPPALRSGSSVHPKITVTKSPGSSSDEQQEAPSETNRTASPGQTFTGRSTCDGEGESRDLGLSALWRMEISRSKASELSVLPSEFYIPTRNACEPQFGKKTRRKTPNCKSSVCTVI